MGYEIDFIAVGEKSGEKSGDAITFRFGNLYGLRNEQTVVVVDGGYVDDGDRVSDHLEGYYGTSHVDIVISTHPDADHVGGLRRVMDRCTVGQLWMHRPWLHTSEIAEMFRGSRVTDMSVREGMRRALEGARDIEAIAIQKGIPIFEPFTGLSDHSGAVTVIGPGRAYYESLLSEFRCTPPSKAAQSIQEFFRGAVERLSRFLEEHWHIETLTDAGETSAENNSSAIVLLRFGDDCILLTADAGIPALTQAVDLLDGVGFDKRSLTLVQVPHHGSRRNVGPTILDRLLGPRLLQETTLRYAIASVAIDGAPKHPSKKVTNAFRRRGAPVVATAGSSFCRYKDAPARQDWGPAQALPFYYQVEEDSDD